MDIMLSIVPIPIEPNLLPEIVNEFPKDLDQQIEFCVIVPTEKNIRSGMKKIFKAAMKKQKIGVLERLVILPLMPFIENKVVDNMKKESWDLAKFTDRFDILANFPVPRKFLGIPLGGHRDIEKAGLTLDAAAAMAKEFVASSSAETVTSWTAR